MNLGVAAHITAAAPGGPRYLDTLTPDERRSVWNAIWLCQNCAALIDRDIARFTVEELQQWKAAAEEAAGRELGASRGPASGLATLERTLTGHTNYVWDVVVTPDGRRAISASNDRTAGLWDLQSGQRICVYSGPDSEVCSIALSPDGTHVAGGCLNGEVFVWPIASPDCLQRFDHRAPDAKVAWSRTAVLTGGSDGWLREWSPDGELEHEWAVHEGAVLKISCLQDGRIATASEDRSVRVWSSEFRDPVCELRGHSGHVNSVAIADAADLAVTGSEDCTVKVWNLASGLLQKTLEGHCDPVWRVAVDANETWIASGSGDNTVRIWDLKGGVPMDELRHDDCVAAIAFSPDAKRLVVGCDDARLYVYRLRN